MEDKIVRKDDNMDVGRRRSGMLSGAMGAIGKIDAVDIIPPLTGGLVTFGGTLLIRKFGKNYPTLRSFAPLLGAAGGALASLPMHMWKGQPALISCLVTSVLTGAGLWAFEKVSATEWAMAGVHSVSRSRLSGVGATHLLEGGRGGRVQPTSRVPANVKSSMDVTAFGANVT